MLPARDEYTTFKQVLDLIPRNLVPKLAREHGVSPRCRTFSPWSHVSSMLFAQFSHALSLNDICDTLHHHSGVLTTCRCATPPSRNGLSYANRQRNADMAEALFWEVLATFQRGSPGFGMGRRYKGVPRRFKRLINVADSTTISLVANCMDWARHRRRKAAAKCHMRLDLQTFLPRYALVESGSKSDASMARELCASIQAGEIVVFDRAYLEAAHLYELEGRGVFWVTRAKTNLQYQVVADKSPTHGPVLHDQLIRFTGTQTAANYPATLRRVQAWVEVDGKAQIMDFITNNPDWAPTSICDLYKARWGIEVFFKELKQTLQLADFLGHSENAVRWQIWTAMLTYLLLRYLEYISGWKGSFARLFTALRGVLWSRYDLYSLLHLCGTARGRPRTIACPHQAYLPGFKP